MRGVALVVLLAACGSKEPERLSRKDLLDPEACAECHPVHYEQWQGSMHAYASEDPVFLALEQKGQEATNGALGDFCVDCHAPTAVREGVVATGADLADAPDHLQGVTCVFCHQVTDVEGTHNNPLALTDDQTFRAAIKNAVDPEVHGVAYGALQDRNQTESADLCGSCHDIVTPLGAHIERTYTEWSGSLYSDGFAGFGLTCGQCHMRGADGVAADFEGVQSRRIHDHGMPGVDIALTEFPQMEAQAAAVQSFLDTTVRTQLCVDDSSGDTLISVTLENVSAGHSFPSGAGADRRAWLELSASEAGNEVWTLGRIANDEVVTDVASAQPELWTLHDTLLDEDGAPTHFFWEAADFDTNLLEAPIDVSDPTAVHQIREFTVPGTSIDRVEVGLHLRPLPLDLLNELVDEGRLDAAVRDALPTWTLSGAALVWSPQDASPAETGNGTCVP